MGGDIKRLIMCLPNQSNLYGTFTLEGAKSLADEKCPNQSETVSMIVLDNNDVVFCLERNNGNWKEKEIQKLVFKNHMSDNKDIKV